MFWESSSGSNSLRGYMLVRLTLSTFSFSSCGSDDWNIQANLTIVYSSRPESIIFKYCIIILFWNTSIVLYYSNASLANMPKFCSFHNWENTFKPLAMYNVMYIQIVTLASISPALHPCCHHRWSECHCLHAGRCFTHFSELSQLTLPYWEWNSSLTKLANVVNRLQTWPLYK